MRSQSCCDLSLRYISNVKDDKQLKREGLGSMSRNYQKLCSTKIRDLHPGFPRWEFFWTNQLNRTFSQVEFSFH